MNASSGPARAPHARGPGLGRRFLLNSRHVAPGRPRESGFAFDYEQWRHAAFDLVGRVRQR
ncbi:hypothetical protein ACIHFE_30555 [Streptomyces sp. NPDC052396]|uniref:hypothetical protein n=1 Tax=Streptomyces sp. NPDC052396 TaxID=3365689 RepID=UPI0037D0E4CC